MVSIGGTTLGLLWGLATAFVTKFTDHVRGKLLHCTISLVEDLICRYAEGSSGQFTLSNACLVAKPLDRSEARGDLVMIQNLLLFKCRLLCYHAN